MKPIILFFKAPKKAGSRPIREMVLFFKASIKNQPGYILRQGPKGKKRWMKIVLGQRLGLFDLSPVKITTLTGVEFGENLNKVHLAQAADRYLRLLQTALPLQNNDTGWSLVIRKQDRRKMGDNANLTSVDSKAVAGIIDLVRHAVLAESHADVEHQNPQVTAIHRFYAPVKIGDTLYRAKLTVKDYSVDFNRRNLHAIETVEIKNALSPGTSPAHEAVLQPKRQAQPTTTERTLSIFQLLRGAIRDSDGQPFHP